MRATIRQAIMSVSQASRSRVLAAASRLSISSAYLSFAASTSKSPTWRFLAGAERRSGCSMTAGTGRAGAAANRPGDRIGRPDQVRILGNYLHHNQHESSEENDGDSEPLHAACRRIRRRCPSRCLGTDQEKPVRLQSPCDRRLGPAGGYDAPRNLVLKGGGYHGRTFNTWTHIFDIHGTGCIAYVRPGGGAVLVHRQRLPVPERQRDQDPGKAACRRLHPWQVFPHEGLEDDWGDDAIALQTTQKSISGRATSSRPTPMAATASATSSGRVDDLFLATRAGFWFSSFGEFPWSYLGPQKDKLTTSGSATSMTTSGATCSPRIAAMGDLQRWHGDAGIPSALSVRACRRRLRAVRPECAGSPAGRHPPDHARLLARRGRPMADYFARPARLAEGGKLVKPMSELRFGDFTGDGVTDVLAVDSGRWAISESARAPWRNLNPRHGDAVKSLFIADLNNNNIDDLIRLDAIGGSGAGTGLQFTWWVSDDGRGRWRRLRSYTFQKIFAGRLPGMFGLAGRFGAAPGGGVLVADSIVSATSSAKLRSPRAPHPTGPPSARFIIECGSTRIFAGDPRPGWMTLLLGKAVRLGTVVRMSSRSGASTGVHPHRPSALRGEVKSAGRRKWQRILRLRRLTSAGFPYVVIRAGLRPASVGGER